MPLKAILMYQKLVAMPSGALRCPSSLPGGVSTGSQNLSSSGWARPCLSCFHGTSGWPRLYREVLGSVPAVSGQVMVSWTGTQGEDQRFSTVDMAVLGGVLGALLLLALICLCILIHKHYRHRFNCCSGKVSVRASVGNWTRQSRNRTNPAGLGSHRKKGGMEG